MAKSLYLVEQQPPPSEPGPCITEIVVAAGTEAEAKDSLVAVGAAFGLFAEYHRLIVTRLGPMEADLPFSQVRWLHGESQVLAVSQADYSDSADR
jgi:hypothetical protein